MSFAGLGDEVAVGVGVVLVNIAAENGFVDHPVALAAAGLCAGKAAVDGHAVLELEGIRAVRAGVVHAGLDPDFVTADGIGERGLQGAGVSPTGAVADALRGGRDVAHAGGAHDTGCGQGDCGGQG